MRVDLIEEEFKEYKKAAAFAEIANANRALGVDELADVADAVADLLYVVAGAGIAWGLPMPEIFEIVQATNMTKFTSRTLKSDTGKVLKPADFQPAEPAIRQLLIAKAVA